jgi:hypothetical protein
MSTACLHVAARKGAAPKDGPRVGLVIEGRHYERAAKDKQEHGRYCSHHPILPAPSQSASAR